MLVYLGAGLCCLLAVAFARGAAGVAALLIAAAAFGYAFLVYRWWVPPAAAAAALAGGYALFRILRGTAWLALTGIAGAALAAFSVLGPADGLF